MLSEKLRNKQAYGKRKGSNYNVHTRNDDADNDLYLPKKIDYKNFCRWLSFPEYRGSYWWQQDFHNSCWTEKYILEIVPRDHGKSIDLGNHCQWAMQFEEYDILYLGWTDRRKDVAQNIRNFFRRYDLLEDDRSPYHFSIKNGGKFDCYLITSKDVLGLHSAGAQDRYTNLDEKELEGLEEEFTEEIKKKFLEERNDNRKLMIVIDDPIDDSFMKERYREDDLERRFMSTIYNINPDKWIFTGTRKFQGDFFDFLKQTFKHKLTCYERKTHLEIGQNGYNRDMVNNPMNLLCPERFTEPGQPNYEFDSLPIDKGGKGKRDIAEIKGALEASGKIYWWYAEYEGNPHPITGEVWDHVDYITLLDTPVNRKYDLCYITIDRATTTKESSDLTGCVIALREISTGNRIIIEDFSDHISFNALLLMLNEFVIEFRNKYESIDIIIIVEKQGGGDDFLTLVKNSKEFVKEGKIVPNKIPEIAVIYELHNTGEKLTRIKDRLYAPLKNGRIKFKMALKNSEIVKEVLNFPHSANFDAIDGVANAEFVLLENYHDVKGLSAKKYREMARSLQAMRNDKEAQEKAEGLNALIEWEQERPKNRKRFKTIF